MQKRKRQKIVDREFRKGNERKKFDRRAMSRLKTRDEK